MLREAQFELVIALDDSLIEETSVDRARSLGSDMRVERKDPKLPVS